MACTALQAQNMEEPQVGEVLLMSSQDGNGFDHVHFPKLNFIMKRGGVGNWTNFRGTKVVVKEQYPDSEGSKFVVLERADGRKFFKLLPSVTASFNKALASGELKRI